MAISQVAAAVLVIPMTDLKIQAIKVAAAADQVHMHCCILRMLEKILCSTSPSVQAVRDQDLVQVA